MPSKSYAYLLNVESSELVFLKTSNIDFDKKQNQNGIKNTTLIWNCLLINRYDMFFKLNSKEPRTRKSVKKHGYFSFGKSLSNKYGKQLVDAAKKEQDQNLWPKK